MNQNKYDLIGDIHGEAATLRDLLTRLGYHEEKGCYRHPERRVIFVGDYIDRGPAIRETLHLIRRMVEGGSALAICGNHELGAVLHDTPDGRGGWLGPRGGNKSAMHRRTHAEFAAHPEEWQGWLAWLRTLPLYLDLPGLRVVHAFWSSRLIAALGGRRCLDEVLLPLAADRATPIGAAVHLLLKGPEIDLPAGHFVLGRNGNRYDGMRVRWWHNGTAKTYRGACINDTGGGPDLPVPECDYHLLACPDFDDPRPLFFGHYWLPAQHPTLLTPKLACLDYSVAGGGPLVAYRWDGERVLDPAKFVYDPARVPVPA